MTQLPFDSVCIARRIASCFALVTSRSSAVQPGYHAASASGPAPTLDVNEGQGHEPLAFPLPSVETALLDSFGVSAFHMPATSELTSKALRRAGLGHFFRPVDIESLGITEPDLRRLLRLGHVERIDRGVYRLAAAEPTEHFSLAAVCARVPKAVICLKTALQVHRIGTRISPTIWVAIPHGTRAANIAVVKVRFVRFRLPLLKIGVERTHIDGVPAQITGVARTVVDCFRLSRLIDRETALEALREVLAARRASPAQMLQLARSCGDEGPLRTALEVLGG